MKRPLVITLNVLSWTAILVYLLLSSRYTRERKQQRPCREVRVVVLDSAERGFITPAMVRGWFASEKIPLVGRELSSINTLELERFVRRRGYVRSARVYASIDGVLTIEIAQRKPVMRFNTDDGYNFYVTDDGYILPVLLLCPDRDGPFRAAVPPRLCRTARLAGRRRRKKSREKLFVFG